MSSLLVFNRDYRLEIQSVILVFSTPSCELEPLLTFSLIPLPPFPCVSKCCSRIHRSVTGGGGGWIQLRHRVVVPARQATWLAGRYENPMPELTLSPSHGYINSVTSVCIHAVCYREMGEGIGGLRQVNTCRQVPFLVNFSEKPKFRVWCLYRYLVHTPAILPLRCH